MEKIRAVFGAVFIHLLRWQRPGNAHCWDKAFKASEMWGAFIGGCKEHHLTQYNNVSFSHLYVAKTGMVVKSLRSGAWLPMASL